MKLKKFTNVDIVDQITCQTLIMDGEAKEFSAGQATKLYEALQCPKDYMLSVLGRQAQSSRLRTRAWFTARLERWPSPPGVCLMGWMSTSKILEARGVSAD